MTRMQKLLDAVEKSLSSKVGTKVIFDPQPVRNAEPHLRLTYMGASENGVASTRLNFQLSLVGAGDGPGVYLAKVIELSMQVARLYNRCMHEQSWTIQVDDHEVIRLLLLTDGVQATGAFSQNEQKQVETNTWSYLFTEGRYIGIVVSNDTGRKE